MDENRQDTTNYSSAALGDVEWVLNKKSKLLIPQHKNQTRVSKGWTGFSGRTLWDWIQFFAVLAIPIIVAGGTLFFTQQITFQQAQLSITASEKQHQSDTQIAQDQQQETDLQTYLDRMSDLLLNQNLRSSKPGDEVRTVARGRTLTVLSELNATRKYRVLKFLYEAGLISTGNATSVIISLADADLEGITFEAHTFNHTDFTNANLEGANLSDSSFFNVNLDNANLTGADLAISRLVNVELEAANLSNASLAGADIWHSDLNSAILDNSILVRATLFDVLLNNASLQDTALSQSKAINTDFSYASMNDVNLTLTILTGSNFNNAYLEGADLAGADLLRPVVIRVDAQGYWTGIESLQNSGHGTVSGFIFNVSSPFFQIKVSQLYDPKQPTEADLSNVDLTNANLRSVKVTSTQLENAFSLKGTILPNGSIFPSKTWPILERDGNCIYKDGNGTCSVKNPYP